MECRVNADDDCATERDRDHQSQIHPAPRVAGRRSYRWWRYIGSNLCARRSHEAAFLSS